MLTILLYVVYLWLFIRFILKSNFFLIAHTPRQHLVFYFLLKVLAGIFLTLVYTYYYTDSSKADIYRYFNDSRVLSPVLFKDPVAWLKIMTGYGMEDPAVFKYVLPTQYFSHPDSDFVTNNTFIIRLNVVLNYFSMGNIYINTLFFNFILFVALTLFIKAVANYFNGSTLLLFAPFFLLPATLFWSAGLLKEPLLLSGLAVWWYAVLQPSLPVYKRAIYASAAMGTLLLIKIQIAVPAAMFTVLFLTVRANVKLRWRLLLMGIGAMVVFLVAGNEISRILLEKRNEFVWLAKQENAGSVFATRLVQPNLTNFFLLLPDAMLNAFLRPYLWDSSNGFQLAFSVENMLFLLLLLFLLRWYKHPVAERKLLAACFLFFAVFNYLVIGVTVPITGALVHYRIMAQPFLLMAVLLCTDEVLLQEWGKQKLKSVLNFFT